jgi:hypothetical protein
MSESSLGTVGHVVTIMIPSNYRVFMPVGRGRSDEGAQDSLLYDRVCLKSVFPSASLTRQVENLKVKRSCKNINRSSVFPFIGCTLHCSSMKAYWIYNLIEISLCNHPAVSSPSLQAIGLRFGKPKILSKSDCLVIKMGFESN